jgi:hypothetical protein
MKNFLAGVVITVLFVLVSLFVFGVVKGYPQAIDYVNYASRSPRSTWRSTLIASTVISTRIGL